MTLRAASAALSAALSTFLAGVVAGSASAVPPAPNAALPRDPGAVARALVDTTMSLDRSIDVWRTRGGAKPPEDVTLYALYQQRLCRLLSRDSLLATATYAKLPSPLRAFAQDVVTAHHELVQITPPLRLRSIRVGPAAPSADLLAYYREAQRRFGISWRVLAAVNLVESAFGKLRSASAAGAQGPMQFMPDTWRRYGLGGNVQDPHDAILGAANYLRASGGRSEIRRALHAYSPSPLYVDAVLRYARRIGADRYAFSSFYSWQVYVRTTSGERRLTGPGL